MPVPFERTDSRRQRSHVALKMEDDFHEQAVVATDVAEIKFLAVEVTDQTTGDDQRVVDIVRSLQPLHGSVAAVQAVGRGEKCQLQRLVEETSGQAERTLKIAAPAVFWCPT